MTTSGSYDFSINRDQIIEGALRLCGVIAQGETPSATQITEGSRMLNLMVKAWEADGPIGSRNVTLISCQVKRPAT